MTSDTGNRKYELTCETCAVSCGDGWYLCLYRIRALRDIPRYGVRRGDLGGFVRSEANLSHKGDCWIGGEARVYEEARVSGDACVSDRSRIYGKARIYGRSVIKGETKVSGSAVVSGHVYIPAKTIITGNAKITDDSHIMFIGPLDNGGSLVEYINVTDFSDGEFFDYLDRNKAIDDLIVARNNDNYSFLFEMARNDPENWPDNEYRFAIEMIRRRAEHWNKSVELDQWLEEGFPVTHNYAVSDFKYELTDETRIIDGHTLHRIRALRDIPGHGVEAGDLGGFIESKANLSHEGDCWVDDDACVYEEAYVSGDSLVGDAAHVSGKALVTGSAFVHGAVRVSGEARFSENVRVSGNIRVCGNAIMAGSVMLFYGACISDGAEITESGHVLFVGPVGPKNQYLTAYRTKGGGFCIRSNDGRKLTDPDGATVKVVADSANDETDSDTDDSNHHFLIEMARSESVDWKDDEYGFMLEMIRCRASQ